MGDGESPPPYFFKNMGRAKFGGTKAKVRGKIGNEIYQVTRNDDGQVVQKVYQAPASREYTNTEPQAKARMIMGQIERMFHILPDVIKYAFATIPNGTLSFQHFSKLNYDLLKQDQTDNWQYWSQFDWRAKRDMTAPAGIWKLTEGSLPEIYPNSYASVVEWNNYVRAYFETSATSGTLGDFLDVIGMMRTDELRVYFYQRWNNSPDPVISSISIKINPAIPDDRRISQGGVSDVFIVDGAFSVSLRYFARLALYGLEIGGNDIGRAYVLDCFGFLLLRESNKGLQFSTCRFQWTLGAHNSMYEVNNPSSVYQSWLEQ